MGVIMKIIYCNRENLVFSRKMCRMSCLLGLFPVSHLSQHCVQICDALRGCRAEALGREAATDCQVQISIWGGHCLGQAIHSGFQLIQLPHDLILPGPQSFYCWVHLTILRRRETIAQFGCIIGLNYELAIQIKLLFQDACTNLSAELK